ncbi:MAG: co-chaperone GroES [Rickettsiales bacterium]
MSIIKEDCVVNYVAIEKAIQPLYDRLIVEVITEHETKSQGGILLPDTSKEEATLTGKVLTVGIGYRGRDGSITPMIIKKGDIVLFGQYSGIKFRYEGKKALIIKESDVIGIIQK